MPEKDKNLGKDVSLAKIAKELGTHRNRITWALKDDPRVPEEERQRIKEHVAKAGYSFSLSKKHRNHSLACSNV